MKYIYPLILLGIFTLTGCVNQEVKYDGKVDKVVQAEKQTLPLVLSDQEKEIYYEEYLKIIEEVNNGYDDADLTLLPIEDFNDEYWVEPEELRKIAEDMVTAVFLPTS